MADLFNWEAFIDDANKKMAAYEEAKAGKAKGTITGALLAGQQGLKEGELGEVAGYDWQAIADAIPEGLSADEVNSALNIAFGSASMEASQKDRNAAIKLLTNLNSNLQNSDEMKKATDTINTAIDTPGVSAKEYSEAANPINAWADQSLKNNARAAELSGKAGSSEVRDRTDLINLERGAKLSQALLDIRKGQEASKLQDATTKAGLATQLVNLKQTGTDNTQKSLAQLLANTGYSPASVDWDQAEIKKTTKK